MKLFLVEIAALIFVRVANVSALVGVARETNVPVPLSPKQQQKFLIHKGRSKTMILRSPSIAGLTLIQNWNSKATQDLSHATKQLVEENPILRGRVFTDEATKQLWIATTNTEDHADQEFFRILPTPTNAPDFAEITGPQERLEAIQRQLVPLFDACELTATQISRNLPLFAVTLIPLPSNYAVYAIHMSHAVGDGVTFFQIVKEISLLMSGLPVDHPIDWNCPAKPTHELSPPSSTQRDFDVSYGAPMMLGALKNFPFLPFRRAEILLVRKDKVSDQKRALRAAWNTTEISGNDVITAALCAACGSSDLFFFTQNARENGGPIPVMAGGNFLYEIPVSRRTAMQPERLRQVVSRHGEYAPNVLPARPFYCGRVGRITSLASIAETVLYDGTAVVCTVPLASFIGEIPMDVAVIFRYDKQHWGILHNFAEFDRGAKLMAELLANGDE